MDRLLPSSAIGQAKQMARGILELDEADEQFLGFSEPCGVTALVSACHSPRPFARSPSKAVNRCAGELKLVEVGC